jgi:hypothetical protein
MIPRHAGDRFVWNESGRTQYARRVQTRDGLQQCQYPVKNCSLDAGLRQHDDKDYLMIIERCFSVAVPGRGRMCLSSGPDGRIP